MGKTIQDLSKQLQLANHLQAKYVALAENTYENFLKTDLINLFKSFKKNKIPLRVLSIGCGAAPDIIPLIVYFKKQDITIQYTGIDIDDRNIDTNKKTFAAFKEANFICCDASLPDNIAGLQKNSFDLIILQHPFLLDEKSSIKQAFAKIILNTVPYFLAKHGHVYASFYEKSEFNEFIKMADMGSLAFYHKQDKWSDKSRNTDKLALINVQANAKYYPEQFFYCSSSPYEPEKYLQSECSFARGKYIKLLEVEASMRTWCKRIGFFAISSAVLAAGLYINSVIQENAEETNMSKLTL